MTPRALELTNGGALLGAILLLQVAGCVPDFPPASRLDDSPQVLALRAEPPVVAPGQEVRLDSLVYWPGPGPEYLWLVCVPAVTDTIDSCVSRRLGGGDLLVPRCQDEPTAPLCYASRDATAIYRVPATIPTDGEGSALVYVELVVGDDVDSEQCARAYRDEAPSERCLVALKRIHVTASGVQATPALLQLQVDGAPVDASQVVPIPSPGGEGDPLEVSLAAAVDPQSVDTLLGAVEGDTAGLPLAWYSDCGELGPDTGSIICTSGPVPGEPPTCEVEETTWTLESSGECVVYVVLRDGRGGVDWIVQRFRVGA